jgi:hypothetical protein
MRKKISHAHISRWQFGDAVSKLFQNERTHVHALTSVLTQRF